MMSFMGSGSDYTAFVDHLGVPAIDIDFGGRYGVYHSIYDDFFWMEKFGDPEFVYHATAARLYTLFALRAAAAEVVPLRFVPYAEAIHEHVDDLRRMIARKQRAAAPGAAKPPLAFDGLPELIAAARSFETQAAALDRDLDGLTQRDGVPQARLSAINDSLMRIERAFLAADGLPGRPWFKHTVYAPGLTTGYASWPLPGIRQAVEQNDARLMAAQVAVVIERIRAATDAMAAAARAAREAGPS
jgi:N-acetylated-alpha-linked acidic dipeptidase